MTLPAEDQIEVNVFGPGYGECVVIHLGSNRWIVVDSCLDSGTKEPAALKYFSSLGIDPAECVELIIATHWHDDHIRGISRVVAACKRAKFCLAAAVTTHEFLEILEVYDERHGIVAGSGTSEMCATLKLVQEQRRRVPRIIANKRLMHIPGTELGHGKNCEIWGLSPSDAQYELSLREIGNLVPRPGDAKRRAPEQGCNDLSVVTWISIGDNAILLGADLEERNDPLLGWSAIVGLAERPVGKATLFKIPHHGSSNGHHLATWQELLIERPTTALTPWNRGRGLPKTDDLKRIRLHSDAAFTTSTFQSLPAKRRIQAVERQLRQSSSAIKVETLKTGHLKFTNGGTANEFIWCVEALTGACHLDDLIALARE